MMITTTIAPQTEQSISQHSVISSQQVYQEAKIDYQILEQKIRNTSLDQFNLLVQLNGELAAAALHMEDAFFAWSDALDSFVAVPIEPDPLPTPGLRLIDGWLHDHHGGRTIVVS
ncbi:hypothetical protein WKK05_40660 (plasmid) [Nostoc sp. UHCC 0302]|uniref:hypothetical protein n=1 Tax=Nostoc sp. UHCC 0302 TaxID=3134896 RepID=UPI00311CA2FF